MSNRIALLIDEKKIGSLLASDTVLCEGIDGVRAGAGAVHLAAQSANEALHTLALRFQAVGRLKAWRNERLAVSELPSQGLAEGGVLEQLPAPLAQLERSAARVLGILTHAVHLVGFAANGDVWLQHRALDKSTDPGLWDTLSGGLLAANDGLVDGVLRETHEEAGLLPSDLVGLQACGMTLQSRLVSDGHILEAVWTYRAQLHEAVTPRNLDGEVMGFACVDSAQLKTMVRARLLTQEAMLSLRAAGCELS